MAGNWDMNNIGDGFADPDASGELPAWGDGEVVAEGALEESEDEAAKPATATAVVAKKPRQTRLSQIKALVAKRNPGIGLLTMKRGEVGSKPDTFFQHLVPGKPHLVLSSTVGLIVVKLEKVVKKNGGAPKRYRHFQLTVGGDVRFTRFNDALADFLLRNSKTVAEAEEQLDILLRDGPAAGLASGAELGVLADPDGSDEEEAVHEVSDDEVLKELDARVKRRADQEAGEEEEVPKKAGRSLMPKEDLLRMIRTMDRLSQAFFEYQ